MKDQKKIKKGKIYLTNRSGGLSPFSFRKKDKELGSKQLTKEQTEWFQQFDLVSRIYPPSSFILLRDRSPILGAAIDCIANDVSSTGWHLALKEGVKQSPGTDAECKILEEFLNNPNPDDSLKEINSSCVTDLQTIGDFSLEVIRNAKGKIAKIYHVPTHTIFRNKDMDRFVQTRNSKAVFFVPFDSGLIVEAKTGKEGKCDFKSRANELIFKKLYSGESSYYGRSPMLSCIGAVSASIACEEFNLSYFENAGIPTYAIILSGEWEGDSVKKLSEFMATELRGVENKHKAMVFQAPEGGKAEFKPLENREKEGSFRLYAGDLDDRILGVYKVPRCKVSIQKVGSLAGSDTLVSLHNYNDSVVEPMQSMIEDIFNTKILPAILDSDIHFDFVLENMRIDDLSEKAEVYAKLLERGGITPNQVIQRLGLGKEYPEGNKFYMMSSLIEVGESEEE